MMTCGDFSRHATRLWMHLKHLRSISNVVLKRLVHVDMCWTSCLLLLTTLVGDCGTVLVAAGCCVGDCMAPVPGYEWQDKSWGCGDVSMPIFSSESPAGGVVPKPEISSGIASQLTLERKRIKTATSTKLYYIHMRACTHTHTCTRAYTFSASLSHIPSLWLVPFPQPSLLRSYICPLLPCLSLQP
jgi:hypothetical protein